MTERTPEQVNRAIAEALGWQSSLDWRASEVWFDGKYWRKLPDWYHSLDAQERDVWPALWAAGWRLKTQASASSAYTSAQWYDPYGECRGGLLLSSPTLSAACAEASLAALLTLQTKESSW